MAWWWRGGAKTGGRDCGRHHHHKCSLLAHACGMMSPLVFGLVGMRRCMCWWVGQVGDNIMHVAAATEYGSRIRWQLLHVHACTPN